MADFFSNENQENLNNALHENNTETQGTASETEAVPIEKIKLGEVEYSTEELSQLADLGRKVKETNEQYHTDIFKVWPEYGKSQTRVKELEGQLNELKNSTSNTGTFNEQQLTEARDAARKLGLVLQDDLKDKPYVNKDDFRQMYLQERAAERLLETCDDLEGEFDGKDGRPAFKKDTVLQYMASNGLKNPEQAYKVMYEKEIDSWKEQQLGKARKPGLITETSSTAGGKIPVQPKITADNLEDMIKEQLYGAK